jgi:hypothetical protein
MAHVPEGASTSVTELEYLTACQAGIPVWVFLIDDSEP